MVASIALTLGPLEDNFDGTDWAIGAYVYFALYYAFFLHLFAAWIRGFSANLCITLLRSGGRASIETLFREYGNGKGVGYVKRERIRILCESGTVIEDAGQLRLTPKGNRIAGLNSYVLRIWNMEYLR